MKTKFILCIIFFASSKVICQSYQWAVHGGSSNGDNGNSIAVDAAGNSFVTGWFQNTATFGSFTLTSTGGYDIFIVKYDNNGQVQWAKRAGGTGTDIGYGIALGPGGNIYLAGTFAGTATFGSISVSSSNGSRDILVARYDANGNPVWVQSAGSTTDDQAQAIAVDNVAGKIYITGYFKTTAIFGSIGMTSIGQSDIFIAKYDTLASLNSTPLWVQYGGGSGYDNAYGICTDASGNAYLTGDFSGTANFGMSLVTSAGNDDILVAKFDPAGNVKWVHRDGGSGLDRGIAITSSGNNLYYTGWFNSTASFGSYNLISSGQDEIFISALDTNGNVSWADKAGGQSYDQGYGICTDFSGNVYVTGAFDSLAQFGSTTILSAGSWDVFIAKYSPAGAFQWVMSGGSNAFTTFERDIGYSIKPDAMQNLYVAGIIYNTASFGPYTITSYGIQDVFVAKISLVTSVHENSSENNFTIFQSPSEDIITIKSLNGDNFLFQLFNEQGQTVISKKLSGKTLYYINVRSLPKGLYVAGFYSEKEIISRKILLQQK